MPCKRFSKESRSGYIITRLNRLQGKKSDQEREGHYIRVKVLIHQEVSNFKCVCTKQQSSKNVKQN